MRVTKRLRQTIGLEGTILCRWIINIVIGEFFSITVRNGRRSSQRHLIFWSCEYGAQRLEYEILKPRWWIFLEYRGTIQRGSSSRNYWEGPDYFAGRVAVVRTVTSTCV